VSGYSIDFSEGFNLKFGEIKQSILSTSNLYEQENSIKTLNVEGRYKNENCAILVALKSDGTQTMFYARKGKRNDENSWNWFCPSEVEVLKGLPTLFEIYQLISKLNEKARSRR